MPQINELRAIAFNPNNPFFDAGKLSQFAELLSKGEGDNLLLNNKEYFFDTEDSRKLALKSAHNVIFINPLNENNQQADEILELLIEKNIAKRTYLRANKFHKVMYQNKPCYVYLTNPLLRYQRHHSSKYKDSAFRYNAVYGEDINNSGQYGNKIHKVVTLANGADRFKRKQRAVKFRQFSSNASTGLRALGIPIKLGQSRYSDAGLRDIQNLNTVAEHSKIARIKKPVIVNSYFNSIDFTYYMMPFHEGSTLNALFQTGFNAHKYTLIERLELMKKLLITLKQYHDDGFIHRDIKMGNFIFKRGHNNEFVVVLIDFDSSALQADQHPNRPTADIKFLSPEGFHSMPLTTKSDIYSLGKTFEYMLNIKHLGPSSVNELRSWLPQHEIQSKPREQVNINISLIKSIVELIKNMTQHSPELNADTINKDSVERRFTIDQCIESLDAIYEKYKSEIAPFNPNAEEICAQNELESIRLDKENTVPKLSAIIQKAIVRYLATRDDNLGYGSKLFDQSRGYYRAVNYRKLLSSTDDLNVQAAIVYALLSDKKGGKHLKKFVLESMKAFGIQTKEGAFKYLRKQLPKAMRNKLTADVDVGVLLAELSKAASNDKEFEDIQTKDYVSRLTFKL